MIKHSDHFHGSDLEKIEAVYGIKKEEIVSFSANVNPLGLSGNLKKTLSEKLDVLCSYPDREYTALRKTISEYCNTDYESIIVGNGSTELISLFIQLRAPKKAVIIGPTYSEYEREISLGQGISYYFPLDVSRDFCLDEAKLFEHLKEDTDLLVLCNPNNPTSTSIDNNKMRKILDVCKQKNIFVMVDETYIEFADDCDSITAVPLTNIYNNLIILRGIAKFFAAPGLRLGYAISGNKDLISQINTRKNPWTINSLAEVAGQLMFLDKEYIQQTKALIHAERSRILSRLQSIDSIKVYVPVANFVLIRILSDSINADTVFETAIRQKMMIRNCNTFPFLDNQYFRFCFMSPEDNDRLLACLEELFCRC